MSGGQICRCPESKKPLEERKWRVLQYRCNHSAFKGYHQTPSEYSAITCDGTDNESRCTGHWRTKAPYADKLYALGKT